MSISKAEISNFTNHYKTGHFYFTLKDEGSLLKVVMFRGSAAKLPFVPENGMKVIVHGRISAFVRDGSISFTLTPWSRTVSVRFTLPLSS